MSSLIIDETVKPKGGEKFLQALQDGRWQDKFPDPVITVRLVEWALKNKYVEEKKKRSGIRKFNVSFRITAKGKQFLADNFKN